MGVAFAKTTFGPPAPTGQDTDKGALIADVQNGIVEMVDMAGNTHALESMLSLLQAQTALATITTAQNLFSLSLPAGALNKKSRALRIKGTVIFTATGTPVATIILKLGSVTLATIATAALAASTNGQLQFEFILSAASTGSSGTIEAHGEVDAQLSTSLGTAVAKYLDQITAVSSAVNLTAALALAVTIGSDTGISSAQLRQGLIEVIG